MQKGTYLVHSFHAVYFQGFCDFCGLTTAARFCGDERAWRRMSEILIHKTGSFYRIIEFAGTLCSPRQSMHGRKFKPKSQMAGSTVPCTSVNKGNSRNFESNGGNLRAPSGSRILSNGGLGRICKYQGKVVNKTIVERGIASGPRNRTRFLNLRLRQICLPGHRGPLQQEHPHALS